MEPNAFEQIWVQYASQIFHLLIYFIDKLNTLRGPELIIKYALSFFIMDFLQIQPH